MTYAAIDSQIFAPLFSDPDMVALFTDEAYAGHLLAVEAALARVEGQLGIIPAAAAEKIVEITSVFDLNYPAMQAALAQDGVPVIELLRQLRAQLGPEAADYLHWGATTQDIMDTAVVLQSRAALSLLQTRLDQLITKLAELAGHHRHTLMAGRTHSQQALPITFGLKVANWLAPLLRHRQRLAELRGRVLVVQFGGAAGTLAALGEEGTAVQQALARDLQLSVPAMPWHTQRDNLVELAGWLSLVSGSLAKMAQDIILLAQSEITEVRESGDPQRGGSSTMPQKANPILSETIIAAARTNASLLGNMHQAQIQEHERGTHGWQMEWLTLPQMFALTASALANASFLAQNLVVNEGQMQRNVATSHGLMLAEAVSFALAKSIGRSRAKELVGEGCRLAVAQNRHLVAVMQEFTDADIDWETLQDEANYLGATDQFIDQVLAQA